MKSYLMCRLCEVYVPRVSRFISKAFRKRHRGCRVVEFRDVSTPRSRAWGLPRSDEMVIDAVGVGNAVPPWFSQEVSNLELLAQAR